MTTSSFIDTQVFDDGVCVITLTNPQTMNAWNYDMHAGLHQAIEFCNASPDINSIVITGAGSVFCAGADMRAVFGMTEEMKREARARSRAEEWITLVRQSKPMVAALNGAAIGIGASLLLCLDQILASKTASISFAFIRMGLVPEMGASRLLPARVGFGAASRLSLTGEKVGADAALACGLVDGVCEPDALLTDARKLAATMGSHSPAAIREVKKLLLESAFATSMDEVMALEVDSLARCYATADHREAVAAFKEKRAPKFSGK